jgi:hypothetical protein
LACLAFALVLGPACTAPSTLRIDTEAYLERMSAWAPVEAETARTLERILATHFADAAEVLREIEDSSQRIRRHLQVIAQHTPRTAEVRRIHDTYMDAWRGLLDGYNSIETGLDTGDQVHLAAGRRSLLRWRISILGVARQLQELSDRVGLPSGSAPR